NNSLSSKPAGKAAQLSFTNGLLRRELNSLTAWATSSLPVPVSPRIKTVESVGATTDARCNTSFNDELLPMMALPNFGNGEVSSCELGDFTKASFTRKRCVFANGCSCQGEAGGGASKVDSNNVVMLFISRFRS